MFTAVGNIKAEETNSANGVKKKTGFTEEVAFELDLESGLEVHWRTGKARG